MRQFARFDHLPFSHALCAPDHDGPGGSSRQAMRDDLPVWDLSGLYAGMDDPAIARDLERLAHDAKDFSAQYQGRLKALLDEEGGQGLAEAVRRYEAMEDAGGRLGSYAGLLRAQNLDDPARAKFAADIADKLTRLNLDLLFFSLEINRIDDGAIDTALRDPVLAHYRPWLDDVRKARPYQLDDKLEQLFEEKAQTGSGAWNRLFDETLASLRFAVDNKSLTLEETLNLLQDGDATVRETAAKALSKVFADNTRQFALIMNTLAKDKEIADRWRGFADVADSRHFANRVKVL